MSDNNFMNSSKPSFPEWSESNMAIMLRQTSLLKPSIPNSVINVVHTREIIQRTGAEMLLRLLPKKSMLWMNECMHVVDQ
jgi:hypothetical protein